MFPCEVVCQDSEPVTSSRISGKPFFSCQCACKRVDDGRSMRGSVARFGTHYLKSNGSDPGRKPFSLCE